MTTFHIIHTADLHLGSLFSATPEVAEIRQAEQLDTLKRILDLCMESNADALLITGDFFDSMKVPRALLDGVKALLSHYAFYIFITPGSHDPATPDSCYNEEWPQNVHIFRGGMEKFEIPEKNTCVWGAGFTKSTCEETLLKNFSPVSSRINVLMLYGELTDNPHSASVCNPLLREAVEACGADYVALGHRHACAQYQNNDALYCYAGTPASRGFDEQGEKGVLIGTVCKGFARVNFVPLEDRRYRTEKIDVSGCENTPEFCGRIVTVLRDRYGERFAADLYDITLFGSLQNGLIPDLPAITQRLRESVFYARLTDNTATSLDLALLMNDTTLRGVFVRRMVAKMQSDSRSRDKYMRALIYGLRAFDGEITINENY